MIALLLMALAGAEELVEPAARPDRSAPPVVVPAELLPLDEAEQHTLGAGVRVWLAPVPKARKVEIRVTFQRGSMDIDGFASEAADVTGWVQDLATAELDAAALAVRKDVLDVQLWTSWSNHDATASLRVPRESLAEGLDLLRQVVREPAYPKREIKRYAAETERYVTWDGPASLGAVTGYALSYGWYPAEHPYGTRTDLAALRRVRAPDCFERHGRVLAEAPIDVVVTGDLTWADLEPGLTAALGGLGAAGEWSERAAGPTPTTRVIAVDMPDSPQAGIRLRYSAPVIGDADRVAFHAVDYALGGHFLARLNANLREDKGFTYGVHTSYRKWERNAHFTVDVDVAARNTAPAIREIQAELARIAAGGATRAELDAAGADAVSGWNDTRQTASTAINLYTQTLRQREQVADGRARIESLLALTPEETQAVAERWLGADAPHLWVVVGPRHLLEDSLQELGPVLWTTPDHAMLGDF